MMHSLSRSSIFPLLKALAKDFTALQAAQKFHIYRAATGCLKGFSLFFGEFPSGPD